VLSARGAVELWSGHLDEAAGVLGRGMAAAIASGEEQEHAACAGHLALVEAARGRLGRATELAARGHEAAPALVLVEPLTERERDVLRHLSGMLNTAEVAGEMYISVNTVKTHLKSIYRKLAATHRGEAVRRARQLDLI
jgi:DNA-binding CsgD family transcriptional regulator